MSNFHKDEVLGRLRRHHYLLINGGGIVITLLILFASGLEIWASVRGYLAKVQVETSLNNNKLSNQIVRSTARASVNRHDVVRSLNTIRPVSQDTLLQFKANDDSLLFYKSFDEQPILVMGTQPLTSVDEPWFYISVAQNISQQASAARGHKSGEFNAYIYSTDKRFFLFTAVPWEPTIAHHVLSQPRSVLLEQLSHEIDQGIAPFDELSRPPQPILHWLPPSVSLLNHRPVFRVVSIMWKSNTEKFGTLVFEVPIERFADTLPPSSFGGDSLILDQSGRIMLPYNNLSEGRLLKLAQLVQKEGLGKSHRSYYQDGQFIYSLGPSRNGWTMIYALSLRQIIADIRLQLLVPVVFGSITILVTWILLLLVKRRVLMPAMQQSERIFESEQLNRTFIETAPVGLGLLALGNGTLLLRSQVMVQMQERFQNGYTSLPAALVECFHQQQSVYQEVLVRREITFDTHDGQQVNLSVSMALGRYRGEDVLVVAFVDITDKKQLEQYLIAAKESADKANAAKSSFLAVMSHEIRTPLNAILGNLELLSHLPLDEQSDRLDVIRHASDSLLSTINDVLDFTKIEAGEMHLEHIEFDILEVVAQVLDIFSPIAQAKGLTLRGELGETSTLPLLGDPTCMRQVINNLLSNALKFTEKGQVILRINVDMPTSLILVEVEDTGIGMSALQQQQMFNAFKQADESINRRYGGSGLGLALSKRLAEAMGGNLSATSELGKGSVFQLSLPLSQAETQPDRPLFSGQQVSVLAIMPECRSYLTRVLTAWGLEVQSYQHPAQIDDLALSTLETLILWGDRSTWHHNDENRLVEEAIWVIDCSNEGPQIPVATGRVLSTSVYGLKGLACALRHSLQGQDLPIREQGEQVLPQALHVLVAEDNPVNRHLIAEQLRLLGCTVCLVEEGGQALGQLQQERFDILLTDLSMPGMDGYTLARRVREEWPTIPVVAVTASATQQEYADCQAAGMAWVLTKPLLLKELKEMLLVVCGLEAIYLEAKKKPEVDTQQSGLLDGNALPGNIQLLFQQTCANSLVVLREASKTQDTPAILHELHFLNGAFGVFDMQELIEQATALEVLIKNSGSGPAQMLLASFCEALEKIVLAMPVSAESLVTRIITLAVSSHEEKISEEIVRLGNELLAILSERQ
ncbi:MULTISPECIES: hybrid sensor histidine kinase/response regulator [unclassified Serratia (in: enterobacteria)]|uniref:hybrid sensor histidine kinase/response regulator n=1 Tax=unclassified Serratia (in: enterobacteria) TaxID=2647522 RepID=UPI001377659E|nr:MULTISPECIES: hybrid sensor histidine kinase/response regulator [unclassified Serratia (in: enterobacteria)]